MATKITPMQVECPVCTAPMPVNGQGSGDSAPGTCEVVLDMSAVDAHIRTHE